MKYKVGDVIKDDRFGLGEWVVVSIKNEEYINVRLLIPKTDSINWAASEREIKLVEYIRPVRNMFHKNLTSKENQNGRTSGQ